MIKHDNYNCQVTDDQGQEHLVYANWLHNEHLDNWLGYCCDAGHTRFHIDKNFDVWSGECKKTDTICKRITCTGCTDDLIVKKYINE